VSSLGAANIKNLIKLENKFLHEQYIKQLVKIIIIEKKSQSD
jgi:hypothetical protein